MLRQLSLPLIQTTCFFCQSHINPPPRDPRNFRCPHCQCWNRYDARGEISSDEPAMHEGALNAKSFAKRGKPFILYSFRRKKPTAACVASSRKDRFLPTYNKAVFCHTCQTNQVCLFSVECWKPTEIFILTSPLPGVANQSSLQLSSIPRGSSSSTPISPILNTHLTTRKDPEYPSRLASLPSYQASVELRYPPVCAKCLPAVEEEIRSRDHMARTSALGYWLKSSKGKGKERVASGDSHFIRKRAGKDASVMGVKEVKWNGRIWMVRGGVWVAALGLSAGVDIMGELSVVKVYP